MKKILNVVAFVTLPVWWPTMVLIELVQIATCRRCTPIGVAIGDWLEKRRQSNLANA